MALTEQCSLQLLSLFICAGGMFQDCHVESGATVSDFRTLAMDQCRLDGSATSCTTVCKNEEQEFSRDTACNIDQQIKQYVANQANDS